MDNQHNENGSWYTHDAKKFGTNSNQWPLAIPP